MNREICVQQICKSYGKVRALQSVTFHVKEGELFGLIGPDGSGKTSLFRILTTLLLADSGTATVCGLDVVRDYRQIRWHVGYMPGRFSLYPDLTVEENLNFFATLFHTTVRENYGLIRDIYQQIEPFKHRKAGALSGGMKQKLALSCALIHRPDILFLDEPTTGVDPVSRIEFWNMLDRLRAEGITILVSTPYMDEASRCGRIALMCEGQCLTIDTPDAIRASYKGRLYAARSTEMFHLLTDIRTYPGIQSCYAFGDCHHLCVSSQKIEEEGEQTFLHALTDFLTKRGHQELQLYPIKPSIEDCFIDLNKY